MITASKNGFSVHRQLLLTDLKNFVLHAYTGQIDSKISHRNKISNVVSIDT